MTIRVLSGGKPIGSNAKGGRTPQGEADARRLHPENAVPLARRSRAMAQALGDRWDGTPEDSSRLCDAYNLAAQRYKNGFTGAFRDLDAARVAQQADAELAEAGCFAPEPDSAA